MDNNHARLSPSSASRWLDCPASVRLSETVVAPHHTHPSAEIGTIIHAAFERCMTGHTHQWLEEEIKALAMYGADLEHCDKLVEIAIKAADHFLKDNQLVTVLLEQRVNPGERIGSSELWGTADIISFNSRLKTLAVVDLKTGRIPVDPTYCDQLMLYAVGAKAYMPTPKKIVLGIIQPQLALRAKVWEIDPGELQEFEGFVKGRVALVDDDTLEPTPTDAACRWCPAKAICPAHT